ncbi:MAG: sulfate transporter [Gammaproteobacteria bacterium]|nr:sulfate transporter [Gammaproteobacteria bacterium]
MRFLSLTLCFFAINLYADSQIRILSTTSIRDSGLYEHILPYFEDKYKIKAHVIATGTAHAINNARQCNGDILITHAKNFENEFVRNGYGLLRSNLMYNDFVVVGPKSDPINTKESKKVTEVFSKIQDSKSNFVSRGDNSGTHLSEINIWKNPDLTQPDGIIDTWYLESGQGMGATLNIAVGLNAYTYSDRATWLKFSNKQGHTILFDNDEIMKNQYGIVKINPNHCKNINHRASNMFYNWITSKEGQDLIASYRLNNQVLFIPNFNN